MNESETTIIEEEQETRHPFSAQLIVDEVVLEDEINDEVELPHYECFRF